MTYAVQQFDYAALVVKMADVGMSGMAEVLAGTLGTLPRPQTQNEVAYFWAALFNAARQNDGVWLWLVSAPHIRQFAPSEAAHHTMPQFASDIPLPTIGGPDDRPLEEIEAPKEWPTEPTEENFRAQAERLDQELKVQTAMHPDNAVCTNIAEYVASFYHSGTGQMMAQMQLMELGLRPLATPEGISFLMRAYPPQS